MSLLKSATETINQNRKGFYRIWLIVTALYIVSLFLGYAVFLIVLGIQFAKRRILIHWKPARDWLARTFDLKFREYDSSKTSPIYKLLATVFHFAVTLLYVVIGFYIVRLGMGILSRDGFFEQNFIYLVFFR